MTDLSMDDVRRELYESMRDRVARALDLINAYDPTSGAARSRAFASDLWIILKGEGRSSRAPAPEAAEVHVVLRPDQHALLRRVLEGIGMAYQAADGGATDSVLRLDDLPPDFRDLMAAVSAARQQIIAECPRHSGEPEPCAHCALDAADDQEPECHHA